MPRDPDALLGASLPHLDDKVLVTYELCRRIREGCFGFSMLPVSVNSKNISVCIQCVLVIRESFTKDYGSRVFLSSPCGPLFLHIEPNQLSLVTRTHCISGADRDGQHSPWLDSSSLPPVHHRVLFVRDGAAPHTTSLLTLSVCCASSRLARRLPAGVRGPAFSDACPASPRVFFATACQLLHSPSLLPLIFFCFFYHDGPGQHDGPPLWQPRRP